MQKYLKRIVCIVLLLELTLSNCFNVYSKTIEDNVNLHVGETLQLKIDVGATKIEWTTSSKRIATVTNSGAVTGIKDGECDIICNATYTSFIFFKENVEYIFHVSVRKRVESNVNNLLSSGVQNDNELMSYGDNDNSYYLSMVSTSFTFDVYSDSNISSSYTICDINKNNVQTQFTYKNDNVWTISPNGEYEKLTTYIVDLKEGARFVDEEYSDCSTLIFMTDGDNKYEMKYRPTVIDDIINIGSDNITSSSSGAEGAFEIKNLGANDYKIGEILITKNKDTDEVLPYKITNINGGKLDVELAKLDEVYEEFEIYHTGPVKLNVDKLRNDKGLAKAIKESISDMFTTTTYAASGSLQIGDNVEIEIDELSDGRTSFKVEITGIKFDSFSLEETEVSAKVVIDTAFMFVPNFYFSSNNYKSTFLELQIKDFESDISLMLEGKYGSEVDDVDWEKKVGILKELFKKQIKGSEIKKRLFHHSFDVMDFFGSAVTLKGRNEIQMATNKNIGIAGVALDIDLVNYFMAAVDVYLRMKNTFSYSIGWAYSKGLYAKKIRGNNFHLDLNLTGKLRDTVQLPRIRLQVYIFTEDFLNITVEGAPQIDLVMAGRARFAIGNSAQTSNLPVAGYISISIDLVASGDVLIELIVCRINPNLFDIEKHLWDWSYGDIIGIRTENDTTKIKRTDEHVKINTLYKNSIDTEGDYLDVIDEQLNFTDPNLKYYTDINKSSTLTYDSSRGILLPGGLAEDTDIYIEYKGRFGLVYHLIVDEVLETTTVAPTTIEVTTVIPTTIIETTTIQETTETVPQETITGNSRMQGKVMVRDSGANNNRPIKDAKVAFYYASDTSRQVSYAYTDDNGEFSVNLPSGEFMLLTSARGFVTLTSYESISNNETKYVEQYLLFSEDEQGLGRASGKIINAVNGNNIKDVQIRIRKNWNSFAGAYAVNKVFYTDVNGIFDISNVEVGYYTIEAYKEGYTKEHKNILVLKNNPITDYNFPLNPVIDVTGDLRVVLRWGEKPEDLDSHLIGKKPDSSYFDVHYSAKEYKYNGVAMANLDHDDVDSYGPETITITNNINGNYVYGVHDFSNRSSNNSIALSDSNCSVEVYVGNTILEKFYIPTGKVGTFWEVFSIDNNYNIVPINEIYNYNPLNKNFNRFNINALSDYRTRDGNQGSGTSANQTTTTMSGIVERDDIAEEETSEPIKANAYNINSTESITYQYDDADNTVKIQIIKPVISTSASTDISLINNNVCYAVEELQRNVEEYVDEHENQIKSIIFSRPTFTQNSTFDMVLEFKGNITYKNSNTKYLIYNFVYDIYNDNWELIPIE